MIDVNLMAAVLIGVFLGTVSAWVFRWVFNRSVLAGLFVWRQIVLFVKSRKMRGASPAVIANK